MCYVLHAYRMYQKLAHLLYRFLDEFKAKFFLAKVLILVAVSILNDVKLKI